MNHIENVALLGVVYWLYARLDIEGVRVLHLSSSGSAGGSAGEVAPAAAPDGRDFGSDCWSDSATDR